MEGQLVARLFGDRPIPEGFSLLDELADLIQSGTLDLRPNDGSSWYDRQLFSLEPLLKPDSMPGADRLILGDGYRRELRATFGALLGLTRETHTKQMEMTPAGAVIRLFLRPELSVEPLPEFYRRRGESYGFLLEVMEDILGEHAVDDIPYDGDRSLRDTVLSMQSLFRGAYLLTCEQVGLRPDGVDPTSRDARLDRAHARQWIATQSQNPNLSADDRCLVPLFYDIQRRKTKVLLFMGYRSNTMRVEFEKRPRVIIRDTKGNVHESSKEHLHFRMGENHVSGSWWGESHTLACPVTAECYVDRLLSREEFQRLCDERVTPSRIVEAVRAPSE